MSMGNAVQRHKACDCFQTHFHRYGGFAGIAAFHVVYYIVVNRRRIHLIDRGLIGAAGVLAASGLAGSMLAFAQSAASPAADRFEVASIKPSAPQAPGEPAILGPPRGGPGTSDPGQITWSNAALTDVVRRAYDKQPYQVTAPEWMSEARFDFQVKVRPGATPEQVLVMWQSLLRDRFGMLVRHESRQFPIRELTVAKGGAKLKQTKLPSNAEPSSPVDGFPKTDADGFPQMSGTGASTLITMDHEIPTSRTVAKRFGMAEFAKRLSMLLREPVVDKTGLTGRYDFNLEYTPDPAMMPPPPPGAALPPPPPVNAAQASEPGSNIESALEKQLGLKLTKAKGPLDCIVVEHAEKVPTEN